MSASTANMKDLKDDKDDKPKESVNKNYKWFFIIPVCLVTPLIVSAFMGGEFLQSLGSGASAGILRAMSTSIIFSGPALAGLCGLAWGFGYKKSASAGFLVVCFIVFFSTSTTTMSFLNTAESKITDEVNETDEVKQARTARDQNNQTIAQLNQQIAGRDAVKWAGMRTGWMDEKKALQEENKAYQATIDEAHKTGGNASTAKAFKFLEGWGISKGMVALIAAFLMDAIPAVTLLLLGALAGTYITRNKTSGQRATANGADDGKKTQGSKRWWSR